MDLTLKEVNKAAKIISEAAGTDANIIFGTTIDQNLTDQIKITVIATGFDNDIRTQLGMQPRVEKRRILPENVVPKTESPKEENHPERGPDQETPFKDDDKYDIPAFLRGK